MSCMPRCTCLGQRRNSHCRLLRQWAGKMVVVHYNRLVLVTFVCPLQPSSHVDTHNITCSCVSTPTVQQRMWIIKPTRQSQPSVHHILYCISRRAVEYKVMLIWLCDTSTFSVTSLHRTARDWLTGQLLFSARPMRPGQRRSDDKAQRRMTSLLFQPFPVNADANAAEGMHSHVQKHTHTHTYRIHNV